MPVDYAIKLDWPKLLLDVEDYIFSYVIGRVFMPN